MLCRIVAFVLMVTACVAPASSAQQPDIGVLPVELTQTEFIFDTAEQHKIRVVVVAKGLRHPWALQFLPSGDALISERSHDLRLVHNVAGDGGKAATLDPQPIEGLPVVEPDYEGAGVLDVVLDPRFAQNGQLYMTFNKFGKAPSDPKSQPALWQSHMSLIRARLVGRKLVDLKELFVGSLGCTCAGRAGFGKDGMIYITAGEMSSVTKPDAQRLDTTEGKILRINPDGGVPRDNPFVGRAGVRPEIFSYGHRDSYGLVVHPVTGQLVNVEHGPNGGDEVNVILPGRNYGWPKVTYGRNYDGTPMVESPVGPGFENPRIVWQPSIGPSHMMMYTGERFPQWKGNLFVASARRGQTARTGGIERVVVDAGLGDIRRELLLSQFHQRIAYVAQGPDGLLYALMTSSSSLDEVNGTLLRIEPKEDLR